MLGLARACDFQFRTSPELMDPKLSAGQAEALGGKPWILMRSHGPEH